MSIHFKLRNLIGGFIYRRILRPIFFLIEPEKMHDLSLASGSFVGRSRIGRKLTRALFDFADPSLEQNVAGMHFKNPLSLAAGYDKDGLLTGIVSPVGFGYHEIGSATGEPCKGNDGQRLWRLKKSQALVIYYGLKNIGAEMISERMSKLKYDLPVGINIAKTNSSDTIDEEKGILDYVKAFKAFSSRGVGDYFAINISCPNTVGGEPFTDPGKLDRLLLALEEARGGNDRPFFLKMPADITDQNVDGIIEVARKYKITGFICTNVTKNRSNDKIIETDLPDKGGISGKVVQELSDDLISYIYNRCGKEFVIIGCGGIFNADDAYTKIKKGASLLQLITGVIFEGPWTVSDINAGLVTRMKKDGYTNISEVIGASVTGGKVKKESEEARP
jgi:dihydroorotate dehydrogenase